MKIAARTVAAAVVVALISLTGAAGSATAAPKEGARNIWCC
jgi:hypothetical protein